MSTETTEITLDTNLSDIGWDDADRIGDDLIDVAVVGDEWGLAWDRLTRDGQDATVRELRDELLRSVEEEIA